MSAAHGHLWDHDGMTVPHPDQPRRLTADAYLAAAADSFGGIEVADGLVVRNMARTA